MVDCTHPLAHPATICSLQYYILPECKMLSKSPFHWGSTRQLNIFNINRMIQFSTIKFNRTMLNFIQFDGCAALRAHSDALLVAAARHSRAKWPLGKQRKRKTLDSNDQNQVADPRFSLKQWFAGGAQSRGLRKPG